MAATLTRQEIRDNPMLASTHVENHGSMEGFTPAKINDSDLPMIMKLLTCAYTRPYEAVIRELVANALDSHRAAGVNDPVTVILPTIDKPELVVIDHGLGLSREDFTKIVGNVGASTKRMSLTSTGHMGIGSKSPYAIADQYQVKAVRDGVMIHALFAKTDEGIPTSKILFEGPTDEGNGVTITVPVDLKHLSTLQNAAEWTLYWRKRGEVEIVNFDKELTHWNDEGHVWETFSNDETMLMSETHRPQFRRAPSVLMGGISYEIPHTVLERVGVPRDTPLVFCLAPKGAIVAPSREALEDTDSLRDTINRMYKKWLDDARETLKGQLRDASSSIDLARKVEDLPSTIKRLTGYVNALDIGERLGFTMRITKAKIWDPSSRYVYRHARDKNSCYDLTLSTDRFIGGIRPRSSEYIVIEKFSDFIGYGLVDTDEFRAARRASRAYLKYQNNNHNRHGAEVEISVIDKKTRNKLKKLDADGKFFTFYSVDDIKSEVPKKTRPKRDTTGPTIFRRIVGKNAQYVDTPAESIAPGTPIFVTTKKELEEDNTGLFDWRSFPFSEGAVLLRENRTNATVAKKLGIEENKILTITEYVDEIVRQNIEATPAKELQQLADGYALSQSMNAVVTDAFRRDSWKDRSSKSGMSSASRRELAQLIDLSIHRKMASYDRNHSIKKRMVDHPKMPTSVISERFRLTLNLFREIGEMADRPSDLEGIHPEVVGAVLDADRAAWQRKKQR